MALKTALHCDVVFIRRTRSTSSVRWPRGPNALLKSHFTVGFRYSDVLHHIQVRSKMEALDLFSYLVRDSREQKGDVIGCLSVISGSGIVDFHSLFSFQLQSSRYGTVLSELQVCCSSIYHHIKEGR